MGSDKHQRIYDAVRKVPRGRVASYGRIAELADLDGHARLVGYALHSLKRDANVPWHRIINSQGKISLAGPIARTQRKLLEAEGIRFSTSGKIDLVKFGFTAKARKGKRT